MAEHQDHMAELFQSTNLSSKKNFIPIRSVTYRKSLENYKEMKQNKDQMVSNLKNLSPIATGTHFANDTYSLASGFNKTTALNLEKVKLRTDSNKTPMFHQDSQEVLSLGKTDSTREISKSMGNLKPIMTMTLHKLSLHTKAGSLAKTKDHHHKKKLAPLPKNYVPRELAPDDYFQLLFDENRKRFTNEDFEGTYDFTQEQVMSRIYNMGFRDPQYFGTRLAFPLKEAPDEQTIREKYQFRLPVIVSEMESQKTLAAHVLGGAHDDVKYIEVVKIALWLTF